MRKAVCTSFALFMQFIVNPHRLHQFLQKGFPLSKTLLLSCLKIFEGTAANFCHLSNRDYVDNLNFIYLNRCNEVKFREKLADAAHNGEMCSSTRIISLTEQDTCNEQPCEIGEVYPKCLDN